MGKLAILAAVGVGVLLWAKAPVDPREWPGALSAELAKLKTHGREALAAGKRAQAAREAEFDREMAAVASGGR